MTNSDKAAKIDRLVQLHTQPDKYKSKYSKFTIQLLSVVLCIIGVYFVDYHVLPVQQTSDTITQYQRIKDEQRRHKGFSYFTQERYSFFVAGEFIEERQVTIEHSPIVKNIRKVILSQAEYTENLQSDFTRTNYYIIWILSFTSIISICCLIYYKDLTDNGFANIVLINLFLIAYILYFSIMP